MFSIFSFSVLLEVVEPEKTDPTVSLKGHESIEVPALTKKDYKLSFFAYREGDYNTKVGTNLNNKEHFLNIPTYIS